MSIYWVFIEQEHFILGDDLGFHLSRVEGLVQALRQGDWTPKINYFITGGLGYATGIFYPNLFLYPFALFRLAGLSLAQSYIVFIVIINWATFMIGYFSCMLLKKNQRTSVCFALIYGLSSYRMADVIYRAAVGEMLAFMVLPIAFVGLYEVVCKNEKRWWLLSAGMSSLFYAHLLSTGIFLLFCLGFLGLNARQFCRENSRLIALLKSAVMTILLTASSLFPMIEQLNFQRLRVQDEPVFYLQRMAESLPNYVETAVNNIGFNNLGIPTFFFLLLCVLLWKREAKLDRQLLLLAIFFLFLATNYFPHWLFHETPFNAIQFPWRYFLLVTFCVSWVAAEQICQLLPCFPKWSNVLLIIILLLVGYNQWQGQQAFYRYDGKISSHSAVNLLDGTSQLGYGQEFLPSGMSSWTSPSGLLSEPQVGIETKNLSRKKNVFRLDFEAHQPTRLIFPLIYYKGYDLEAKGGVVSAIEDAGTFKGEDMHGFVQVTVTGQGSLVIKYKGTLIQKLSGWLSALTVVGSGMLLLLKRQKRMKYSFRK